MLFPAALLASALLLQQTPPAAQTSAATPAPASSSPTPADTGPVANLPTVNISATPVEPARTCRTEAVTGSRFGRRVCRSNVQTAEEAAQSREMLRRMQGARMPDG